MQNVENRVVWVVRGHPRSLKIASFDRAHTTSYSSLIATIRLSCTVYEIWPSIGLKSLDIEPEVVHLLVRENLADDQRTDAELGRVVQLRLQTDERPTNESIQTDWQLTKKMVVKWDNLEVHNGLVYRRLDSPKPSTPTMLQWLVPRCCVPDVLRLCHTGTVSGHFGVKRTMVQVQRRFYWATWKTDVKSIVKHVQNAVHSIAANSVGKAD